MWNLPAPGIEPVSPALAGRFLSTGPPGKPWPLSSSCFLSGNETPQVGEGEVWHLPLEQEWAGYHSPRVLSVVSPTSRELISRT